MNAPAVHPVAALFPMLADEELVEALERGSDHWYFGEASPHEANWCTAYLRRWVEGGFWWVAAMQMGNVGAITYTTRPIRPPGVPLVLARYAPDAVRWIWRAEAGESCEENPFAPPTKRRPALMQVYFIEAMHSGRIKIGVAEDPYKRLLQLDNDQAPEPLRLLGTLPGGYELESTLHRRFAASRVYGEWFLPAKALLAYIAGECGL